MDFGEIKDPKELVGALKSEVIAELKKGAEFCDTAKVRELIKDENKLRATLAVGDKYDKTEKEVFVEWFKAACLGTKSDVDKITATYPNYFPKAFTTTASSSGGYAVPTVVAADIIKTVNETYWHRTECTVLQVPSVTGQLPSQGTGTTVQRKAENTAATESTPTIGRVQWSTYGLRAWTTVSNELIASSTPDIMAYLVYLLASDTAYFEFTEMITGTGSSAAKGLNAETITEKSFGAMDYPAICAAYTGIKEGDRQNAIWVFNDVGLASVMGIRGTSGVPYLDPLSMTLLGKRVRTNAALSNDQGYFGNFKSYYWFDLLPISIYTNNQGQTLMTQNSTLIGMNLSNDAKATRTAAFVEITGIS